MHHRDGEELWDVVVVGGGLAGLAAAATAAAEGCRVRLLDRRQPGGRAATDQVGRFRFNRGAHALYLAGAGHPVLRRLGVQPAGVAPPAKNGHGLLRGRIGLLPQGPGSLARTRLLGVRDKARLGKAFAAISGRHPGDLSGMTAREWFDELGLRGDVLRLMEMLTRLTTYVADLDRVSADLVAGQIQAGNDPGVQYLHGGWASLVDGLAAAARDRGATVETTTRVERVVPGPDHVTVERTGGALTARQVVLATGGPDAHAALLPDRPPAWDRLGPPARVACLDMGFAEVPKAAFVLGVDRPLYLIRHAPPAQLAPPGGAVVHALLYLRPDEAPSPDEARGLLEEHCRAAGIEPGEAEEARYLHNMVACGAVPLAEHGGLPGRPGIADSGYDRVLVAGDWVGPSGHLADAALAGGEAAGRAAARAVTGRTTDPVATGSTR